MPRKNSKRTITYAEAIKEATEQSMLSDRNVFLIGEGVPDPKGIFGTTLGLRQKFSSDRIMDMPLSENALTGVCIGAAISGLRPILTHQRVDFSLLSFDQIINNAAKWRYMFGGSMKVPLVIRMVIGKGWGQGAQHSQNLQALFAHIPGLKVVMPSTAHDAKGLLISSIKDDNPVIFIEHRWLHNLVDHVPKKSYEVPIGKAKVIRKGNDLTIITTSLMTIEAIKASKRLSEQGIDAEIVDVRTLKPLDEKTLVKSVKKTGRVIVADSGHYSGGFAGEIVSVLVEKCFNELKSKPIKITLPDIPTPTSRGLTRWYYPFYGDLVQAAAKLLGKKIRKDKIPKQWDVPDKSFTGPF